MEIDVFTLFPEAFSWFEGQRHVANTLAAGHRLRYVNYRDHTPLRAGQVDDTPFGGGAGMVLRVDVVEAAFQATYCVDPVALPGQRRVIALTPAGRVLDDALVDDQHCLVEEQAGVIVLTDLGSRTGTFVRMKGKHELAQGDEVLIGRTRLMIELPNAAS